MSEEETQILVNEELTAYLDGELSGDELACVEQRLQDDPEYLAEMQKLQQSWDWLDVLPQTPSYEAFVKTTMEMVVQDGERELGRRSSGAGGFLAKAALFLALPGAVFASGYVVTSEQITAPYQELIRELPLIENHDRYAKLNLEIDFLTQLNEASLFTPDVVLAFPSDPEELMPDLDERSETVLSLETIKDRELRLAEMKPRQIETVKRSKEMFNELSAQRRQAITEFHQQFLDQKNKPELVRTMVAYYDWLKSLGATERIEVLDEVDSGRRIEMIAKKIEQQNLKDFGKAGATMLPAPDTEPFFKWYERFLKARKSKIMQSANRLYVDMFQKKAGGKTPPDSSLRRFQRFPLSQKVRFLIETDRDKMKLLIAEEEVEQLRRQLSLDANELLDNQEALEEQKSLIVSWMDAANQAKFNIDPKRLREFYNTLPQVRRDELDSLSPRDWKSRLKQLYRQKRFKVKSK